MYIIPWDVFYKVHEEPLCNYIFFYVHIRRVLRISGFTLTQYYVSVHSAVAMNTDIYRQPLGYVMLMGSCERYNLTSSM